MSMGLTSDADLFRGERARRLSALRSRRYWRRKRQAEREAKREAKRLARRMETGETEINDYADFVQFMIARRLSLGLTQLALDDLCGFSSGFISHLETPLAQHGRTAGPVTMQRWFHALGVRLRPVVGRPAAEKQEPLPDELAHRRRIPEGIEPPADRRRRR